MSHLESNIPMTLHGNIVLTDVMYLHIYVAYHSLVWGKRVH